MPLQFVIIGNPENRRVGLFQQALKERGQSAARVVPYGSLLQDVDALQRAVPPGSVVRIESPGENFAVEQGLLALGASLAEQEGSPFLSSAEIEALEYDHGLVLHPRQWYLGYCRLLSEIEGRLAGMEEIRLLNPPGDIRELFDKRACHARCRESGCAVPEAFPDVHSFDELQELMRDRGVQRIFLKLAHASSASGVVAVHQSPRGIEAITSAELVERDGEPKLYNSLKVRRYTDLKEIRTLIDLLCREGVHVERWMPKASLSHGRTFDLRVVVIAGEARQFVVRESRSPLTNLHLGNRRGDGERLQSLVGEHRWRELMQVCEQAAGVYPRCFQLGVDLLLTPGCRQSLILELNAFGDLLPGILWEGEETYQSEIGSLLEESEGNDRLPPDPAI
ncbi:STM4014 family protein [Gimesia panareensis]|uniref:STM4014 family protein n=1 Tax=Gimesia panareensis TaxID=2527978 RepID=UPI001188ED10|nr:STM4014 family protein [Gimesia panareensis]QDU48286.1 hypothetical protein Pan110_05990 [Gimesia panareensis]